MHQADEADSTAGRAASGGKFDKVTGRLGRQIMYGGDITSNISYAIDRIQALTTICHEIIEEATDEHGFWFRSPTYHSDRLTLLGRINTLLSEEVERAQIMADAACGVVIAEKIERTRVGA